MMINFKNATKWRYATSMVSALLVVLSLLAITVNGFNWGLDFTGGVVTEIQLESDTTSLELQNVLEKGLSQQVSVVAAGNPGQWVLRYAAPEHGAEYPTMDSLLAPISNDIEILNSSLVGPQVGQDLAEQGGLAVLITLLTILAYLSFRFEWRLASGALLALVHDVIWLLGFFAFTGLEFNLTVLAALLAVVGYSLNDSIIISDRIREMLRANVQTPIADLNNQAIAATLSRTMVTSGTTLITVGALWILGGEPLYGFSVTMFIGIIAGTWSSISVGTLLPELFKLNAEHYQPEPVSDTP